VRHFTPIGLTGDSTLLIGYHLGVIYLLKVEETEIKLFRQFDAHAKPITGIILNEDIGKLT